MKSDAALTDLLRPKKFSRGLTRIGSRKDGGYLVPIDFKGIQACFSPGAENRKTFEDDLCKRHGISCHICDFSSDIESFKTKLIPGLQTFEKAWLAKTTSQTCISLQDWVDIRCPGRGDLLLQLDIEGGEYDILLNSKSELIKRFRIIIIEFHDFDQIILNPERYPEKIHALEKLFTTHICVHVHPNNCCGMSLDSQSKMNIPNTIEISLIRKDRFSTYQHQDKKADPFLLLPHPLDVQRSVLHKPPMHLNRFWLGRKARRHPLSILRIWIDWLDFIVRRPFYLGIRTNLEKFLKNNHFI